MPFHGAKTWRPDMDRARIWAICCHVVFFELVELAEHSGIRAVFAYR